VAKAKSIHGFCIRDNEGDLFEADDGGYQDVPAHYEVFRSKADARRAAEAADFNRDEYQVVKVNLIIEETRK